MAKTSTSNRVRIIGGRWRSRLVGVADAPGLRPTPDRVRETLFNWLGQDLNGLRCLDLFAGSGALGFEALSRNARYVTMVEQSQSVFRALEASAASLQASEGLRLLQGDALEFLRMDAGHYDVVFLDPPYTTGLLAQIWPLLGPRLAPNAAIYAEHDAPLALPSAWKIRKAGRAGGVYFYLIEQASDEE